MVNKLSECQNEIVNLIKTELSNVIDYTDISTISILAENNRDIEYEIKNALGEQGLVCVVMTPTANFIGNFENKELVFELDDLTVQVVENVSINRDKDKDEVLTGQDLAMAILDLLSNPKYGHNGQFSPVNYEQGEDESLLVNKITFKCIAI